MTTQYTEKITLPEREWKRLAHARMVGTAFTYGRDLTVIDEDIVKPWAATGLYKLGLSRTRGYVIVQFNRERLRHLLEVDEPLAFAAFYDWRDVMRGTK